MSILKIADTFCKHNKIDPMKLGDYKSRDEALAYVYLKLNGVNEIYHRNGRDVKRVIELFFDAFYTSEMTEAEANNEMQLVMNGDSENIGILHCVDFVKNHKHFQRFPNHSKN